MDYTSMHQQNMVGVSSYSSQEYQNQQKKQPRPAPPEQSLKCPRCDSTNTKFCYYNNYSLSQPRYFCKSCRRYWTKGGILRNIPIGGANYRKHKRSSSSSATKSLVTTNEPHTMITHDGKTFPGASFCDYSNCINNEKKMEIRLGIDLLNKQPLGFHSDFGIPQSMMGTDGGMFRTNQMENAGYAFGNGGSDLEQIAISDPNRVLWGFPWQQMNMGGGSGHGHVDQIDSGREIWSQLY
ncbi:unnamed protein product [Cochlearia groenlandica]